MKVIFAGVLALACVDWSNARVCCQKNDEAKAKKLDRKDFKDKSIKLARKGRGKQKLSKDELLRRKKIAAADEYFQTTRQGEDHQYSGSFELFYEDYMYNQYTNAYDLYNELIYDSEVNVGLFSPHDGIRWKPLSRLIKESFY